MSTPLIRGRCPGALTPMASGDGLVVRIRPRLAALDARQARGLADLAERFGNGVIDLTNRANLQVRGVAEADHPALLDGLDALGLVDADPGIEARRNILVTPFWQEGDLCHRLALAVEAALPDLPALPHKVGIAVDAGAAPGLTTAPADFRFERGPAGLILRGDGAPGGRAVTEAGAIPALIGMAQWLATRLTPSARRMRAHAADLPAAWTDARPAAASPVLAPGPHRDGTILGAPFGQIGAADLRRIAGSAPRLTPFRLIRLAGPPPSGTGLIATPGDPLLTADACPGAPLCPQASVETRALARRLAGRVTGRLHVSGCAKGCARRTPAAVTLVGRDGAYDLVRDGTAGDRPTQTGLTADMLVSETP